MFQQWLHLHLQSGEQAILAFAHAVIFLCVNISQVHGKTWTPQEW